MSDSQQPDMKLIAAKIKRLVQHITVGCLTSDLTSEDIRAAEHAFALSETLGPMLDPTAYRNMLYSGANERTDRRIRICKELIAWYETEMAEEAKNKPTSDLAELNDLLE